MNPRPPTDRKSNAIPVAPPRHLNVDTHRGATTFSKSWGPIPWSRLLFRTKYGWYTQFRALQRKKLGWSVQLFFLGGGEVRTPHPPSGCARGHTKVADRAGAAVLTRYVRTVVGDGLTVTAAEAGQTVTRVAALTAVTARRSVATRLVVGAEVQV